MYINIPSIDPIRLSSSSFFVLLSVSQRTLDLQPEVISILVLKVGILGSRSTLVPLSENRRVVSCEKVVVVKNCLKWVGNYIIEYTDY